ncbi:MAG: alpha/beta fold hydrolase, partial [Methylobacter sp.]|nr:alpha/beta fold hydrolase [Methylobacter sp.]
TLACETHTYSKPLFDDVRHDEAAVADPTPFFIQPEFSNGFGVLLVHGLLASPAELRAYGEYLVKQGYTVLGIRLKGHGTSPHALRDQSWEDWYGCVQRGFNILKVHCPKIFVAGFSTGGALALKLAAEHYPEMIGVIAVSVPLKFVNPAFMLVPLLHGTNTLVGWVSAFEGVKPFIDNEPEHPAINYRNMPVRALYELRLLLAQFDELLPQVNMPVLILYGDEDPIVSPKGAPIIMAKLGSKHKQIHAVKSRRHGILMENIDGIWDVIDGFLNELRALHFKEAMKLGTHSSQLGK